MNTTLVAMFDSYAEAQAACQKLSAAGIDKSMVNVTSTEAKAGNSASESGDDRGFFAKLFGQDEPDEDTGHYAEAVRRGSAIATVTLADASKTDKVTDILETCGARDVDQRVEAWKADGYKGYDPKAPRYTAEQADKERETLKVMQEELKVGKREVRGATVRVHQRVIETPVTEKVTLHQEKAVVERHPVDRAATPAELDAFGKQAKDLEFRETTEEAVVSKTARVVEEVTLGQKNMERTETVKDTIRRTDVDVEKVNATSQDRQKPQPR